MVERKRTSSGWAAFHAVIYALPFWLVQPSLTAWCVICGSHFLIDRFGLARYVIWAKNIVLGLWPMWLWRMLATRTIEAADRASRDAEWRSACNHLAWTHCKTTGYPANLEPWLATILLIVADNTIHLLANWTALRWL